MKNIEIKGIVTALSPISHKEIEGQEKEKENKAVKPQFGDFRCMPFILKGEGGNYKQRDVYTVSGNAMRGIGRGLLFTHTFEDVLDIDFEELLPNMSQTALRYLVSTLQVGGVTPKESRSGGAVPLGVYDKVLKGIPMLDLLGGVYIAHHFNGAASIGNLVVRAKETQELFSDIFEDDEDLISIDDIETKDSRYSHVQPAKDASENMVAGEEVGNESEKKNRAKIQMLYGTRVLPAGTQFYWRNLCNTDNEGTELAFKAMIALTIRYGRIGGMGGKGLGRVAYDVAGIDPDHDIQAYDEYILEHKDECIEAIKLLAEEFKYALDAKKTTKKKA